MAKEKRAVWFKLYLHQKSLVDMMPDDVVGRGLKAALDYFESGIIPQTEPLVTAVFASFKPFIEEANKEYITNVENGKKGAQKKKALSRSKPPLPPLREKEKDKKKEKEKEEETEEEKPLPAAPVTHSPFHPPKLEEVSSYCQEKGYIIDPQRFVDYYTSIGWTVGKSPMKDWKAAVRNWNSAQKKKEESHGKIDNTQTWTVGTVL